MMKKMSSSSVDIKIVSEPNLVKIENFLNDSTYRETIEYSANFNTRLCLERRLRLPFLDPQTGVAQNHCSLFMDRRQRMPGFREGQLYTYPAARWRKTRRQYLIKRPFNLLRRGETANLSGTTLASGSLNVGGSLSGSVSIVSSGGSSVAGSIGGGTTVGGTNTSVDDSDFNAVLLEESSSLGGADTSDSKDSQNIKDDLPKEWFYDEMDMTNIDDLEEPKSPDDEYDYDPRYGNKKRKKRRPGKKALISPHIGDGPRKGRPPAGIISGLGGGFSGFGSGIGSSGGGGGSNSGSPGVGRGRGRRKNNHNNSSAAAAIRNLSSSDLMPNSPTAEPPSFESVAAAVENLNDSKINMSDVNNGDLRNYRKYL